MDRVREAAGEAGAVDQAGFMDTHGGAGDGFTRSPPKWAPMCGWRPIMTGSQGLQGAICAHCGAPSCLRHATADLWWGWLLIQGAVSLDGFGASVGVAEGRVHAG